jgi:hypothetical protein
VPTNFETIVSHNVVADANAADARCVVTGKSVLNGALCRGTPFDDFDDFDETSGA